MTLRKALDGLPGDRGTEALVRSVLEILRVHGEAISMGYLAGRLEVSEFDVRVVVSCLADADVVRREGDLISLVSDPVVSVEVDRYIRRVDRHSAFVRSNVAKFRDRRSGS